MKVGGIYRIVSPSGNCYVGSSTYIVGRFCQHRSALRLGTHHSIVLQNAVNRYGLDAMRFEALLTVFKADDLLAFEQQFIDELRPEYNMSSVAAAAAHDPMVAARMSRAIKSSSLHATARLRNQRLAAQAVSRPVVRLTDGLQFESGYDAARALGARTPDNIFTAIRTGDKFSGHYWKYADSAKTLDQVIQAASVRTANGAARSKMTMIAARQKGVVRTSDGAVFASIAGAARSLGCSHTGIQRALREGSNCQGSGWSYV